MIAPAARAADSPERGIMAVGADGRGSEAGGRPRSIVPFGTARPPTCILWKRPQHNLTLGTAESEGHCNTIHLLQYGGVHGTQQHSARRHLGAARCSTDSAARRRLATRDSEAARQAAGLHPLHRPGNRRHRAAPQPRYPRAVWGVVAERALWLPVASLMFVAGLQVARQRGSPDCSRARARSRAHAARSGRIGPSCTCARASGATATGASATGSAATTATSRTRRRPGRRCTRLACRHALSVASSRR